jgi:PAS domain S-box-containing protein
VSSRLEMLGRLIDASPAVLFMWRIEPGGWPVEVVSANVERLVGYSAKDFTSGRVSWPAITHPEDGPSLEREVKDFLAAGHDQWSQQYRLIAKDGKTIWAEDWNQLVRDADGKATHIQALVMDITARKRAELELGERSRQLARLASELTVSEQRERRRLAELLHEHLQQLLVGARMGIHSLAANAGKRDRQALDGLGQALDEALASSRSITRDLAPPVSMHKDLPGAMRWLALEMRTRHCLAVSVQMGKMVAPVTEALAVLLFTAARELLLNVVKHAGCGKAGLRLKQERGAIVLAVSDKGKGATPGAWLDPSSRHGFGLFSIRERSELLGGKLMVDTSPRCGMRVTLALPLPAEITTPAEPSGEAAQTAGPRQTGMPRGRHPGVSGQPIRVVFADDHRTVREGLVTLLRSQGGIAIVGEAENGKQAVDCVERLHPDVVVMDVSMPVMDGVEATRVIVKRWPEVRVIGLSMYDDAAVVQRMRDAGATDYVTKSAPPGRLIAAILACASKGATA